MPVPDLIEQYRVRRDAWIAQADELARLRDEVRGSAEREAMEIVTAARRDVRQIVMEARRELLVLSAQVQAALGEAVAKTDPTALLDRARGADAGDRSRSAASRELSEAAFAPEDAVKSMLDEARADMDALAEDARTVPFQAVSQPIVSQPMTPASPRAPVHEPMFAQAPALSPAASRVLLSSPFLNEAIPVPAGRRLRTFVTLFGVAGAAVVIGTVWWLRTSDVVSASPEGVVRSESTSSSPASPAVVSTALATAPVVPAKEVDPSDLSIVVEARRQAWIRTTVDGHADLGRTFAAGETFRVSAERSVALRVGDAGAVYVSVNKGEARPLGRDGQVVTRQFVVEGAVSEEPPPARPAPAAPKPVEVLSVPTAAAPTSLPATVGLVQPVAATPSLPAAADPAPVSTVSRGDSAPVPAPRPELPTPGPSSPASVLIAASRQWLDAYHRQDRAAMAALSTDSVQLADERRNEERFPAGLEVSRTLDRVSVQIAADTAVLTAVMTERSDAATAPRVSPISQVWVLSGGQWRVRQVRLVSEARLNQIFR